MKKRNDFSEEKQTLEKRILLLNKQKLETDKKHRDQIVALKEKHQNLMTTQQSDFEKQFTQMNQANQAIEKRYQREAQARDEEFAILLEQTRTKAAQEKAALMQQMNDLVKANEVEQADKEQRIENLVKANEKTIDKCKTVMGERNRYKRLVEENK